LSLVGRISFLLALDPNVRQDPIEVDLVAWQDPITLRPAASFAHFNYQDPPTQVRKISNNKQSDESNIQLI
jgi:hypothetical protein